MEVSYGLSPEAVIVSPVGRVDEASWQEFGNHLAEGVERAASETRRNLVIDLSQIEYMSSRGLRALTIARREAGETVAITLAAPNERMREILAISRYDKLFHISDRVDTGE